MSAAIPRTDLADRFTPIIDELCRFVAAHAGRNRRDAPVVILLCSYLRRLVARFAALAGRSGVPAHPGCPGLRHPPRTSRPPLPRRAAWLLRLVPCVGNYGGQIRTVLVSEEFAALLIATPSAGRLLRPLCRMFGIGPDDPDLPPALFHIPARPAPSRPEAAHAPAVAAPAVAAPPGRSRPPGTPPAYKPIPDPPLVFRPKRA